MSIYTVLHFKKAVCSVRRALNVNVRVFVYAFCMSVCVVHEKCGELSV